MNTIRSPKTRLAQFAVAALLTATCAASAYDYPVVEFEYPVAFQEPGWTQTIEIEQYDPPKYRTPMRAMEWELQGAVGGSMGAENTDTGASSEVTMTLSSLLELYDSDDTLITSVEPTDSQTVDLDAYDGDTNFSGPSGETVAVDGSESGAVKTFDSEVKDRYSGSGTINVTIDAAPADFTHDSTQGKDYEWEYQPTAGGTLVIRYTLPEPSTFVLFLAALVPTVLRRPTTTRGRNRNA